MQATAEQMCHLCESRPELDVDHPGNVYDKVMSHVATALHKVLAARAEAKVTQTGRDNAYQWALDALQPEFEEKVRGDDRAFDIFTERVINRVLDSLQDEARSDIDDWRAAWLEGLREAIEGRIVVYTANNLTSFQVIRQHGEAIAREIYKRFTAKREGPRHQQLRAHGTRA